LITVQRRRRTTLSRLSSRAEWPDFLFRAAFWRVGPRSRGIPPPPYSFLCSILFSLSLGLNPPPFPAPEARHKLAPSVRAGFPIDKKPERRRCGTSSLPAPQAPHLVVRELAYPEFFREGLPLLPSEPQLRNVASFLAADLAKSAEARRTPKMQSHPISSANHVFSTLAQRAVLSPLPSTHAHLSHSKPPITPAFPTLTNLLSSNPFLCNTCEKIVTLSARRQNHLRSIPLVHVLKSYTLRIRNVTKCKVIQPGPFANK
jgi:hypothetical protein